MYFPKLILTSSCFFSLSFFSVQHFLPVLLTFVLFPTKKTIYTSTGKAAREMYFRTLALEEAECDPALTVLNYAPGPVQTEMTQEIENNAVASDVRNTFRGLREEKTMLQPIDTTIRFLKVIETGDYETGAHVDYYDN